jgi:hypothetical protein
MKKYWFGGLALALMLFPAVAAGCSPAAAANSTTAAPVASTFIFTTQPGSAVAGSEMGSQPVVWVTDASGNIAFDYNGPVTIGITPGTGSSGAVLSGTLTITADAGVAEFTDLAVDTAGTGYTLTVTADSLSSITSAAFDVAAPSAPTS